MATYRRLFQPNSSIFITMVAEKRKPLFIDNIQLLRASFKNIKKFKKFEIEAIVVLPDHLHMLIKPENIDEYPAIISGIKHYFSRNFPKQINNNNQRMLLKRDKGIWQRRYWEHTIRDDDYIAHIDYIHYNPIKHGYVQKVEDWKFSTFNKYVKEGYYTYLWGAAEDIKSIIDLNYE